MNNLIIKGVECKLNSNGIVELNLEHIARGLGFVEVKNGKEYVRWRTVNEYLNEFSQQVAKEQSLFPTSWDEDGIPNFVPENIFYKLCFKAKNEIARSFQDLVTDEILPSIRKSGGYMVTKEEDTPETIMARALQIAQQTLDNHKQRLQMLEEQNQKLQVRSDFVDLVFNSDSTLTLSQTAKALKLGYGRGTLIKILKQKGIFFKTSTEPTQKYVNSGYFKVIQKPIPQRTQPNFFVLQTLVTQKGIGFIAKTLGVVLTDEHKVKFINK